MESIDIVNGRAVVSLDAQEIRSVMNSMNEALEFVGDQEFATRLGTDKSTLEALFNQFDEALRRLDASTSGNA